VKRLLTIILVLSALVMGFSQELLKSELESRKLFKESLNLLFEGNKYEARIKLNEAMAGEIYITDIPRLWYYAAKLDLQLGMIDRALQDLENALLFSTVNEEAKTLKNFIENMRNFSISNYATPTFSNLHGFFGVKNSFEKFYNPVDVEILNSSFCFLYLYLTL
jgi:tetratricopeptide (TPR) repeat protein